MDEVIGKEMGDEGRLRQLGCTRLIYLQVSKSREVSVVCIAILSDSLIRV